MRRGVPACEQPALVCPVRGCAPVARGSHPRPLPFFHRLPLPTSCLQILNWYPNGITYWGAQATGGTLTIGGEQGGTMYRVLLRFDDLHRYIPPSAVVESAELTVTVVNWNAWLRMQVGTLTHSRGWLKRRWGHAGFACSNA